MKLSEILNLGFVLRIGKHQSTMFGYFATLHHVDSKVNEHFWCDCGHGITPLKAVKDAWRVKIGGKPIPEATFLKERKPV